MTFSARVSSNAERDFLREQTYYDEVAPHQTGRFVAEVFTAARLLVDHIEIGGVISADVRRWQLGVFPCQLWYRVNQQTRVVRIIAVVGDAQDRQRFADRLV